MNDIKQKNNSIISKPNKSLIIIIIIMLFIIMIIIGVGLYFYFHNKAKSHNSLSSYNNLLLPNNVINNDSVTSKKEEDKKTYDSSNILGIYYLEDDLNNYKFNIVILQDDKNIDHMEMILNKSGKLTIPKLNNYSQFLTINEKYSLKYIRYLKLFTNNLDKEFIKFIINYLLISNFIVSDENSKKNINEIMQKVYTFIFDLNYKPDPADAEILRSEGQDQLKNFNLIMKTMLLNINKQINDMPEIRRSIFEIFTDNYEIMLNKFNGLDNICNIDKLKEVLIDSNYEQPSLEQKNITLTNNPNLQISGTTDEVQINNLSSTSFYKKDDVPEIKNDQPLILSENEIFM